MIEPLALPNSILVQHPSLVAGKDSVKEIRTICEATAEIGGNFQALCTIVFSELMGHPDTELIGLN